MTYEQALEYIHGVSNFFCKPGLERVRELCSALGNPQRGLKFIHVGGTNGKGSVSSMLSSVLCAEGYKVGLYTSPYVLRFNERIRINGKSIGDDELAEITEYVKLIADRMTDSPTEFELITAIAFEYFNREKCDVVLLEVGMGGRLDATNIIDSPLLSVITGIALDHTAFLGDTVEKIADEKAGIIKPLCPVLYGGEDEDAFKVISAKAKQLGSDCYRTDHLRLVVNSYSLHGTELSYKARRNLSISLLGEYQPKNVATVLDAIDILNDGGFKIGEQAIYEGLKNARWSARFEIIHQSPTVIFDGAHNPQGINAAVESIKKYFDRKVVVFTGVLRDKDYRQIGAKLAEVASMAYTITPDNPRALPADEYAKILQEYGVDSTSCTSIDQALKMGIEAASKEETALCCLGSLYTYQDVIKAIKS